MKQLLERIFHFFAGDCPWCGSSNTETTDNGTNVCYDCGTVW